MTHHITPSLYTYPIAHTCSTPCTLAARSHTLYMYRLSHPHAGSVMGTARTQRCQMPLHQHTRTTDSPQIEVAISRPPPRSHGNVPIMHTTLCSRYSHYCCHLCLCPLVDGYTLCTVHTACSHFHRGRHWDIVHVQYSKALCWCVNRLAVCILVSTQVAAIRLGTWKLKLSRAY